MALLEALIAFVVLALATFSVLRIQTTWGAEAAVAQQRSQALRFGQRELESVRAFAMAGAASGTASFASIVSSTDSIDPALDAASLATYRVSRTIASFMDDRAKAVDVSLTWNDRNGSAQRVTLQSVVARADPSDSAALQIGSITPATRGAHGRAASIPVNAKDLGHGRSAMKLASNASVVVLLDNRSGEVIARCEVDARQATSDLSDATLGDCTPLAAQLLSGVVRFAPDGWNPALPANGFPLALDIALTLTDGPYPEAPQCRSEAVTTASATAPTDRFVSYRCIVMPRRDGTWSGRSEVMPAGWTIGRGAADRRVCRYVSDTDHSGAIDRNVEHTERYVDVHGALMQQNFLVVRGDLACPSVEGDATTLGTFITAPHQP